METRLGYCCINLTLAKLRISVNHTCRKDTFQTGGLSHVSKLALKNVKNLLTIVKWNTEHKVYVYRMSSDMFPWMSEYEIEDLPDYQQIKSYLQQVGDHVLEANQRLSFHPGPFNVLGSPNPELITKTIKELNQHSQIMDIAGLPQSYAYPINIHCNGTYGDKDKTLERWCLNHSKLSKSAQSRLVVENDDKASMYSVKDLYQGIFSRIKVPITFDYHHHRFNSSGLSEEDAFKLAASTWQYHNITPLFHYSSCRRTFEDPNCKAQAHADYVYERINTYNETVDIEVESKAKDLSLFRYFNQVENLLESYLPM